jgi:hypothetical protein
MFALRVWVGFGSSEISEIDHKNIRKEAKVFVLKLIQQNI